MAEFYFKRSDYTLPDSDADRRGVHKKGDLVNYKPDGFSDRDGWATSQYPVRFVCVKCPGITVEEAEAADRRGPWRDNFDYEVLSSNPTTGVYTVRVFETNAGASNQNGITDAKVRAWLENWGCNAISATTNSVQFDFRLWPAAQSEGFWDVDNLSSKVSFVLNSYDQATGIANITVTLLNTNIKNHEVMHQITRRGGNVVSFTSDTVRFTLDRAVVFTAFKADVKRALEKVYKRHRYSISAANVDAIIAAGGIVTRTRAQLLAALIDHQAA